MGNPIDNLRDYNKVRIDLQNAGGNMEKLYDDIGDTAVAKAAPGLLLEGGKFGGAIVGVAFTIGLVIVHFGKKRFKFMKDRKEKIKNEPALKKEFEKAVENEIRKEDEMGLDKDVVE